MSLKNNKAIIVTGTPGTGKTTFAKKLTRKEKLKIIDVTKFIKTEKLSQGYDVEKQCEIIDELILKKKLIEQIKKNESTSSKKLIIDSHMSQILPKKYVEKCYVTKCNLKELKKRLKTRKYSKEKIKENLDCEIFDICLTEAQEKKYEIEIIHTD
ncbi:AAA family ATPase [Candidatus Woesearchaeota archaeon]|jgi:adenylate kinase|nr:AAA family ATPase [Candidatus Woesearchaeota archaeon]